MPNIKGQCIERSKKEGSHTTPYADKGRKVVSKRTGTRTITAIDEEQVIRERQAVNKEQDIMRSQSVR